MIFRVPVSLCQTALLSSGPVTAIARVTVFSGLQSVLFVAIGALHGLMAMGVAVIVSSAVSATIWLQGTSRHIGLSRRALLPTLRKSARVALLAAIGPALALLIYGPYPKVLVMPLVLGGAGGLAGFVAGTLVLQHPV